MYLVILIICCFCYYNIYPFLYTLLSIFDLLIYLLKFIQQSNFYIPLIMSFISFFIFILVVIVRIATPRFKLESLTKLGWAYGLLIILVTIILFFIGFFLF